MAPSKGKRKQKQPAVQAQATDAIGESQEQLTSLAMKGEIIPPDELPRFKYKVGQQRLLQFSEPMCNLLLNLSAEGYTQVEIAARLGVSEKTLSRFMTAHPEAREALDRGVDHLKASIRRKQIEIGLAGDTTMLIWLGKQHLGQKDQRHVEATGTVTFTHTVSETRRFLEQEAGCGDGEPPTQLVPH